MELAGGELYLRCPTGGLEDSRHVIYIDEYLPELSGRDLTAPDFLNGVAGDLCQVDFCYFRFELYPLAVVLSLQADPIDTHDYAFEIRDGINFIADEKGEVAAGTGYRGGRQHPRARGEQWRKRRADADESDDDSY